MKLEQLLSLILIAIASVGLCQEATETTSPTKIKSGTLETIDEKQDEIPIQNKGFFWKIGNIVGKISHILVPYKNTVALKRIKSEDDMRKHVDGKIRAKSKRQKISKLVDRKNKERTIKIKHKKENKAILAMLIRDAKKRAKMKAAQVTHKKAQRRRISNAKYHHKKPPVKPKASNLKENAYHKDHLKRHKNKGKLKIHRDINPKRKESHVTGMVTKSKIHEKHHAKKHKSRPKNVLIIRKKHRPKIEQAMKPNRRKHKIIRPHVKEQRKHVKQKTKWKPFMKNMKDSKKRLPFLHHHKKGRKQDRREDKLEDKLKSACKKNRAVPIPTPGVLTYTIFKNLRIKKLRPTRSRDGSKFFTFDELSGGQRRLNKDSAMEIDLGRRKKLAGLIIRPVKYGPGMTKVGMVTALKLKYLTGDDRWVYVHKEGVRRPRKEPRTFKVKTPHKAWNATVALLPRAISTAAIRIYPEDWIHRPWTSITLVLCTRKNL